MMKKTWFTVKKVHNNIYALAEFFHWEKVVSYLVLDRSRAFLIDTGMGYESISTIIKRITKKPITVLLSHAHWDHIGGIGEFDDIWVYDNDFERKSLNNGFTASNIPELNDSRNFQKGFTPRCYSVLGKSTSDLFGDGHKIYSDSFVIDCIHTPGHTPGSCCFFIKELKVLFTGDTVYPGPLYAFLPESNISEYIHSVEQLQTYISEIKYIFPGHNSIREHNDFLSDVILKFRIIPKLLKKSNKNELNFESFSFMWR